MATDANRLTKTVVDEECILKYHYTEPMHNQGVLELRNYHGHLVARLACERVTSTIYRVWQSVSQDYYSQDQPRMPPTCSV